MISAEMTIRPMTRPELDLAVEWAAQEGWNPGLHDADAFFAADSGGFLIGELDGEPAAVISAVRYGGDFGFVGFYIVRPELRSQGLGLRIWNAAMSQLAGRNLGLDGVVAQQENYRKSGFKLAYRNIRFEGAASSVSADSSVISALDAFPLESIIAYDGPFFPAERRAFLTAWLRQPEAIGLGISNAGRLAGYGMIRPCRTGYKIGPLFADSSEGAEALLNGFTARIPAGSAFFLDVPETNPLALDLAERHGMRRVFETARMYTGEPPDLPLTRLFGVTSFELG